MCIYIVYYIPTISVKYRSIHRLSTIISLLKFVFHLKFIYNNSIEKNKGEMYETINDRRRKGHTSRFAR
jgi:hypothetical protein